jgi:drug/metabolite transporter (DMT)-like permease
MQAIVYALLTYIGWGAGDIFGAIYSRKVGGYAATFWSSLLRLIFFLFYIPFVIPNLHHLTFANISLTCILSIIFLIGACLFFEAFRSTNASLVGTIAAAFVVPTILFSVIFLHETLTFHQSITISIIILGLLLTTLDGEIFRGKKIVLDKGIIFAFITMILWGIYFAFIKITVKELGWFLPSYTAYLFCPIILLIMRVKKIPLNPPYKNHGIPIFIAFTVLSSLGNLAYNLGIEKGYVSTVIPIAGSYPTLFVLLAFIVFKDKVKKLQMVGICISLIGIVIFSILSR